MGELANIRHEHFCREYVRTGGNGAEAYRRVSKRFPNKPLRNRKGASVIATVLRKRPEIKRREQELKAIMAKKSDITIERVLTNYQEALDMAKALEKPADMISAATAQAKLVGLLRDRVESGNVGDFDGLENISDVYQKVKEELGDEKALALMKAYGHDMSETTEQKELEETISLIGKPSPSNSVN